MNPETLKYLKQDQIGKVIAKGLADVYMAKPQTPIKYLAQWLKNYSKNQRELQGLIQKGQSQNQNLKLYSSAIDLSKLKDQENSKKQKDYQSKIQAYKKVILNHEYQEELLLEDFPEFVEQCLGLTGVYIGELNHPNKPISDEDTDQNSHLDTTVPKLINYIGSSVSQKELMRGQILPLDKGVTGGAFSLSTEEEPPKESQEGQPVISEPQLNYIFIPNVVRDERIHYFRLPKLGAYLAVPLVYNSYLSEPVFDAAVKARTEYLDEMDVFEKQKDEDLKNLQTQLEETDKKLHELTQKNVDASQTDSLKQELQQIKQKIETKKQEQLEHKQPQLPLQKREFVFCADNLGTDEELKSQDIDFIVQLVRHFRESWEKKEKELLAKDVETQINYTKSLEQPLETTLEKIEKILTIGQQAAKQLQEIQNETLRAYKQQELEFNCLKTVAKEESKYCQAFLALKNFRVVKYRNLIQNILYFLNFRKNEINLKGKTTLNWKMVREKYITKQTYDNILAYIVQGSKQGDFQPYLKATALSQYFDALNIDQVFQYNIGLGIIAKFIKKALKHRIRNVNWRREQKEVQRKEREDIIAENEKINQQKAIALEKHRISLAPEDVQTFNEEDWATSYDAQHQLQQIPPQVVDDIDNDI